MSHSAVHGDIRASAGAPPSSCGGKKVGERTVERSHLKERAIVLAVEVGLPCQQILASLLVHRPSSSYASCDDVKHYIAVCRTLLQGAPRRPVWFVSCASGVQS